MFFYGAKVLREELSHSRYSNENILTLLMLNEVWSVSVMWQGKKVGAGLLWPLGAAGLGNPNQAA